MNVHMVIKGLLLNFRPDTQVQLANSNSTNLQFLVGRTIVRRRRHLQEQVEVIVHQTISCNPAAGKFLTNPYEGAKRFLLIGPQDKFTLHHSRNAVVVADRFFLGIPPFV